MRNFRVLISGFAVLMCCAWAQAAKKPPLKDPQVIVAGAKGSLPVGSVFSFVSPTGTSPITLQNGSACDVTSLNILEDDCIFQNVTGSTWTSLNFAIAPKGQSGIFTCTPLAFFTNCFFNRDHTQLTFYGGPGIAANDEFLISVLLWLPGTSFSLTATLASGEMLHLPFGPRPAETRYASLRMRSYRPNRSPSKSSNLALFLNGHVAADWRRLGMLHAARG
jgi:hypothetical protein